ncbi:Uncharacterised protein [uncultured archaeon]|nr:Uncharacterised protein [uncultured archaeon]
MKLGPLEVNWFGPRHFWQWQWARKCDFWLIWQVGPLRVSWTYRPNLWTKLDPGGGVPENTYMCNCGKTFKGHWARDIHWFGCESNKNRPK